MAASATFALKAGVWFRRDRLLIISPVQQPFLALVRQKSHLSGCPDSPGHLYPLLSDSVGDPSSPAVCADSPRSRAPLRKDGSGRNLHRSQRIWTFGRPCQREEGPDVYRDRNRGAKGIWALSNGARGGCLLRIASVIRVG